MIGVIARLRVKEGKMDTAVEAFRELMAHVAEEEGCLHYTLNRNKKDPDVLVVMERYRDKEALKVHGETPHFGEFFVKIAELLDGEPEINRFEESHSI